MRNDTKLDLLWDEVEELKKSGGGGGSDLPDVTSADNGKVLGVVNGAWNKMDAPSGGIDYSTTEQDTGLKWVDGKSIYRKTIFLGDILKSDTKTHDHGISNLGDVIKIYGTYDFGENNDKMPLPYISTSINYAVALGNVTATNFLIDIGSSYTSAIKNVYVTLEYTKATTTKKKTTKNKED